MTIKLNKLSAIYLIFIFFIFLSTLPAAKADCNSHNTEIAESSRHIEYLATIFAYKGRSSNNDIINEVTFLFNHRYAIFHDWSNDPTIVSQWIERAFNQRFKV